MEADQDSLFQQQPELYPPLPGALSVGQGTLTPYHASVSGGHYSQSYQPACWSHSPYDPQLDLTDTLYPPPGSLVSATTNRMTDLLQRIPAPGFHVPGEGFHVSSSDWDVHAELGTWDLPLSPSDFSTTNQEATVEDETGNATDSQAILADLGLEEQDLSEISYVADGTFKCDDPACTSRKPFKRKEHLTRHRKTCHVTSSNGGYRCDFCRKNFNRRDNWRQHLLRHTLEDRPRARVAYHKDAVVVYAAEQRKSRKQFRQ